MHRGSSLARRLAARTHSERAVVDSVANWIASHLHYEATRVNGPFRASWVLRHRSTTCRGYANAMAAMLRVLGIPSRVVYGFVSSTPLHMSGPGGSSSTVQWGGSGPGEMHAWLVIWFPGSGWVPFDPQHEKFFTDPRHFAFSTHVDAQAPSIGHWSATPRGGGSPTGAVLAGGYPEIVPGDGNASVISVTSRDDFHAGLLGFKRDVRGVLLLSR